MEGKEILRKKKKFTIAEEIVLLMKEKSLGQGELARKIGASPSRTSEWLAGTRSPSSDALWKLGKLAPFPQNVRFWELAGLTKEDILAAAQAIGESRLTRPKEGDMVLVPRFRETEHGREEAGPAVPLPSEFVPNPLVTIFLLVDEKSTAMRHSPHGLFIVDTSFEGAEDLSRLWGHVVLVQFLLPDAPSSHRRSVVIGTLELVHHQRLDSVAAEGSLTTLSEAIQGGIRPVGVYTDQEEAWDGPIIDGHLRHSLAERLRKRAFSRFRLNKGIRILGKVVGRLPGHFEK
jgi:transcriptional regulator with XRE-family HTH domain